MTMDRYLSKIVRKLLVSYNWYVFLVSNTVEGSLSLSSFPWDPGPRLSFIRSVSYHVMGKEEFFHMIKTSFDIIIHLIPTIFRAKMDSSNTGNFSKDANIKT